jgi:hypothetical protein
MLGLVWATHRPNINNNTSRNNMRIHTIKDRHRDHICILLLCLCNMVHHGCHRLRIMAVLLPVVVESTFLTISSHHTVEDTRHPFIRGVINSTLNGSMLRSWFSYRVPKAGQTNKLRSVCTGQYPNTYFFTN